MQYQIRKYNDFYVLVDVETNDVLGKFKNREQVYYALMQLHTSEFGELVY